MRLSSALLWLFVLSLGGGLLTVMFHQTVGFRVANFTNVWLGCFILAGGAAAAWACAVVYERGRARWLMLSGMAACIAAAILWTLTVAAANTGAGDSMRFARLAALPSTFAAGTMLAGLLLLPRFTAIGPRLIRVAAVAGVFALGAHMIAWIWLRPIMGSPMPSNRVFYRSSFDGTMYDILMIIAIVTAAACMVTYILARTREATGEEVPDHERRAFSIACPRCGSWQNLRTEGDACHACGLKIRVSAQ